MKRALSLTRLLRHSISLSLSLSFLLCLSAHAGEIDWARVEKDGTSFLSQYVRINTTDPPGNEIEAAKFLAKKFGDEGIEAKVFESEKGRGIVLARLPGSGGARPVVLLNHLDVVPADPQGWAEPPFDGTVKDGYVWGRGAIDCKGMGVVEAMSMIALKRAGRTLPRDVLFLGTAGEEVGGDLGAGWFAKEHLDALEGAEFLLNEGGGIRQDEDGTRSYEVAVSEKTPFWLRLTATGQGGHGSTPRAETAVTRLVRALDRIHEYEPRVRVVPEVETYYRAMAQLYKGSKRKHYLDLRAALQDPTFREEFLLQPLDAALVRNTVTPTVLVGSEKTNVIPRTASADLDGRLLPGEDPDAFLRQLKQVVADDHIEFEVLLHFSPTSSGTDNALYHSIEQVAAREKTPVIPSVLRGFTDSHFFRKHGIISYGFVPVVMTGEDERTIHGVNERLSQENIREGTRRLVAILEALGK